MQTPRRGRAGALEGVAASGGVGVGPALVHDPTPLPLPEGSVDDRATEVVQLRVALDTVASALAEQASAAISGRAGVVLAARAAMAAEPALAAVAVEMVRENGMHPARAMIDAAHVIAAQVDREGGDGDPRGTAVLEVGQRVARHLLGMEESDLAALTEPVVVVADDLSPAIAATLDPALIRGLATRGGSRTSHTAIIARSLGIPAVVGVVDLLDAVRAGSLVVVDGDLGQVLVDPAGETLDDVERRPSWSGRAPRRRSTRPGGTRDGHRVELSANVSGVPGVRTALDAGAEGVGLWRTELDWLARTRAPDEGEQTRAFREAAELLGDRRLAIRTFDVGADKPVPFLAAPEGPNPALGIRGVRLARRHTDVVDAQLRAVVRAAPHGRLAVLAPMVTTVDDVHWFHSRVAAAGGARARLEVGAMVEVPSAVLLAGDLARELDFLSIGTNDLGQYLHAADRAEGEFADLQDPFQPALLRSVAMVADAAEGRARVAVCGEAAGEPAWALLAVGLGVTELSMSADALPRVRSALASRSLSRCRSAAAEAVAAPDLVGVRAVAAALLG